MKELKYKQLFQPLKVNGVTLRNRIIASPIDTHVSKEKATGGAALMVLGGGFISKEQRGRITTANTNPFQLEDRTTVKKTRNTLNFWRQGGALVSIELLHSGMYGVFTGTDYVYGVCKGIREDGTKVVEVDEALMAVICEEYYESASAAKYMGFDMVTAHFAHGWLVSEFLSPTWNHREDCYGGSYENRIKFPRMILQAVRKAVGPEFPIDMRINGKDWIGEGMPIEEVARFLQDMANEGLVDMANISVGADIDLKGNIRMATHPNHPHMVNIELSKFIKERVSIPITVVGGIETPEEGEKIISEGYADAVWIGRAMIADPKWAEKAYKGQPEEITPCLRCLNCFPLATNAKNIGCSVNPRMNKEADYPLNVKAVNSRHVVVVGAGPAGMKAALTAEQRGHRVTLLEKSDALGGIIKFTDYVPSKQDLNRYKNFLIRHVEESFIEVRLNFDATPERIEVLNPEVLMVAVGAAPITPPIKGIDGSNVVGCMDVFPDMEKIADNLVIIGGGTIGCELAIDLAEYGKHITIVEMTNTLNSSANRLYKVSLEEHMKELSSIKTMVNTKCIEIKDTGVIAQSADGSIVTIPTEQVIVAAGMRSKSQLAQSFYGITPETYLLGDCKRVGQVMNATNDAYFFAENILD